MQYHQEQQDFSIVLSICYICFTARNVPQNYVQKCSLWKCIISKPLRTANYFVPKPQSSKPDSYKGKTPNSLKFSEICPITILANFKYNWAQNILWTWYKLVLTVPSIMFKTQVFDVLSLNATQNELYIKQLWLKWRQL